MESGGPFLSVILVIGPHRKRAQRSLNALCAQTALELMEIIVVDLAPLETPRLEFPVEAHVVYLQRPDIKLWSEGRYQGLLRATAPAVASIEEHAYAAPKWAEALIRAHEGPWAAVGYAFVNANPQTYLSRACFVNDYGPWMHPATGGPTSFVPGHNISYRREVLMSFGEDLEELFALDFSLQDAIRKRALPMCVEPDAIVAHENFFHISQMIGVHIAYSRLLAARRVTIGRWSMARRLLYAVLVPLGTPALSLLRYIRSFAPRRAMWIPALQAIPIFVVTRTLSAPAEAVTYLFGGGDAEMEVMCRWEMMEVRSTID